MGMQAKVQQQAISTPYTDTLIAHLVKEKGYSAFYARLAIAGETQVERCGDQLHQAAQWLVKCGLLPFIPTNDFMRGLLSEREANHQKNTLAWV